MDQTYKLLQSIVENARTGADACDQLLKKTDDAKMRDELMTQKQQYESFARDAEKAISDMGHHPHPQGMMARCGMWMGMQMNTMMDKTSTHIAEMLIEGATMGVVEITKAKNTFTEADANAQGIASDMIVKQQEAIERLKGFLLQKQAVAKSASD